MRKIKLTLGSKTAPTYEQNECPNCKSPLETRRRTPKILSYLLFVSSFATFLWYTSSKKPTPFVNGLWISIQIGLGVWAAIDRMNNKKPVFYCRSCRTRIPS